MEARDVDVGTARILAIADEVDASLGPESLRELRPDLLVSCGDLPFDHLEYLLTIANVPLVFVPGNHDPEIVPEPRGPALTGTLPAEVAFGRGASPGVPGGINLDGRVVEAAGLRLAGLGGSVRYHPGPNQYSQSQMRRRALKLELGCRVRRPFARPLVDVLVTHAPPFGVGDEPDPAHVGFQAFHRLVRVLGPRVLLHGHVHPYGAAAQDRRIGDTVVLNSVGVRLVEVQR